MRKPSFSLKNSGFEKDDTKMKKQINLPIRANLLRCTLIMLPLLAVCVIPFALAQRTYRGKPDERYSSRPPSRVVNPTGLASTLTPATPDCEVLIDERFDDIRNLPG